MEFCAAEWRINASAGLAEDLMDGMALPVLMGKRDCHRWLA
jgi:hypothetical protein